MKVLEGDAHRCSREIPTQRHTRSLIISAFHLDTIKDASEFARDDIASLIIISDPKSRVSARKPVAPTPHRVIATLFSANERRSNLKYDVASRNTFQNKVAHVTASKCIKPNKEDPLGLLQPATYRRKQTLHSSATSKSREANTSISLPLRINDATNITKTTRRN